MGFENLLNGVEGVQLAGGVAGEGDGGQVFHDDDLWLTVVVFGGEADGGGGGFVLYPIIFTEGFVGEGADVGFIDNAIEGAAVKAVVDGEGDGLGLVTEAGFGFEPVVVGVAAVAGIGGGVVAHGVAIDADFGDALVVAFEHIEAVEVAFHGVEFIPWDLFGEALAPEHETDGGPADQ